MSADRIYKHHGTLRCSECFEVNELNKEIQKLQVENEKLKADKLNLINTLKEIANLRGRRCISDERCTCYADIAFFKLKELREGKNE